LFNSEKEDQRGREKCRVKGRPANRVEQRQLAKNTGKSPGNAWLTGRTEKATGQALTPHSEEKLEGGKGCKAWSGIKKTIDMNKFEQGAITSKSTMRHSERTTRSSASVWLSIQRKQNPSPPITPMTPFWEGGIPCSREKGRDRHTRQTAKVHCTSAATTSRGGHPSPQTERTKKKSKPPADPPSTLGVKAGPSISLPFILQAEAQGDAKFD